MHIRRNREAPGMHVQRPAGRQPQRRQLIQLQLPRPRGDAHANQHPRNPIVPHSRIRVELEIRRRKRAHPVTRHVQIIVLVHLVVAGGEVPRARGVVVAVVRVGLAQQAGEKVMQLPPAQPVAAQADRVDPLQLADPPRRAGGDLLVEHGVLVDVDGAPGQPVRRLPVDEPRLRGEQVAAAALHVPGVLVGDALVGRDERRPVLPPVVAGEGLARGCGSGELNAGELGANRSSVQSIHWSDSYCGIDARTYRSRWNVRPHICRYCV